MKDLSELFLASGVKPSEDEYGVMPIHFAPIDITLKVVPTNIDLDENGPFVTFSVLIEDKLEGVANGVLRHTEYQAEVTLPVAAIQLAT